MRGEALILNFGELKGRLLQGGAYFRGGANSNIYIILFYLKIEYLTSDKSLSCFSSRLSLMGSVQEWTKYNLVVPLYVVKYAVIKFIELTTKEMHGNQLGKLIFKLETELKAWTSQFVILRDTLKRLNWLSSEKLQCYFLTFWIQI